MLKLYDKKYSEVKRFTEKNVVLLMNFVIWIYQYSEGEMDARLNDMIMAFLALAPIAGAILVWGPAAAFLAMEGSWGKAALLVASGIFVIVAIDNLLRPALVGKRLQIHTVPVFISVVGGMLIFGPSGLLLGPIVLTVTQVLLELNNQKSKMVFGGA